MITQYPTIYNNDAYGASIWYASAERDDIIAGLADAFDMPVNEFAPIFMENENEVDLIDAYNNYGDDPHNLARGWQDVCNSTDQMYPGARAIVEAFQQRMAPLADVLTVTEVANEYDTSVANVRDTIKRGQIPARKSGGTWLIRRCDAEARWGDDRLQAAVKHYERMTIEQMVEELGIEPTPLTEIYINTDGKLDYLHKSTVNSYPANCYETFGVWDAYEH